MRNIKDRVTIYEVAKASGVSLATVSRVINHNDNVTEATRQRVQETIQRLGYKPSALARGLATNRTTNIGIVIPSANYVYIANMLNGMTDEAKIKGYQLTLFVTNHSKDDALQMVEKVITSHVDGAIIFDDELDVEEVNKISSYKIPLVVINNALSDERVACINFGYEKEIKNVIKEYFAKGDKKMYFLHLHHSGRLLQRIEKAFVDAHVEAMRGYGIYSVEDSYRQTYADFMEIFKSTRSGYFLAHRDSLAAAVINAAIDSGLRVPEEVEVLSIVGTKYASILRPHVSSLHIDMKEVGAKAMQIMGDLLSGNDVPHVHKFESTFVKRDSTKY
ncbi:MAG: LacI family DNA-binding transcriptional regulator [Bacilli bacterium]|jgi:LacI family transcriptional regulator